ncbi:MAG TPA: Crp/Fnr family transcriptional regulator [Clostridia bacterium]|nr:Crp/Fnr family transcriptional regulator [Clostridia bacterium]
MSDALVQFMQKKTMLSSTEIAELVKEINVQTFEKGTILLRQGEISTRCYFVLTGCIRQYSCMEDGRENTYNFFTEEQAVVMVNSYKQRKPSEYFLSCVETSTLLVGELDSEESMYNKFPKLKEITRSIIESNLGEAQDEHALFISSTPEERYRMILKKRPDLINRVPQHQLASYLGITPESLSRIKKRLL